MTRDCEVLRLDRPKEHEAWLAAWSASPDREVFGHPAYAELHANAGDQVLCAAQSGTRGAILLPLIQRPLSREPWGGDADGCGFDLVSPYGYGGPFAWGEPDVPAFWEGLRAWARRERVVTCFLRLSLFAPDAFAPEGTVESIAENVVRDLRLEPEALWMDYDHKVRKNVKCAQRNGVEVVDDAGERLEEFLSIYYSTMERREAAQDYYFPKLYFERIVRDLHGQFRFFHALKDRRLVSTELVLVSRGRIYSFLGGTTREAFPYRPNDLLKHAIALWGAAQGKEAFVLGGGYEAGDGILRYKTAFAPSGLRPFRVAKITFDDASARALAERRRRWEEARGRPWTPKPGFFPKYRG